MPNIQRPCTASSPSISFLAPSPTSFTPPPSTPPPPFPYFPSPTVHTHPRGKSISNGLTTWPVTDKSVTEERLNRRRRRSSCSSRREKKKMLTEGQLKLRNSATSFSLFVATSARAEKCTNT